MYTYLIIGALDIEVSGFLGLFEVRKKTKSGRSVFYHCGYKGKNILVARIGMGNECSKLAAESLKDIFDAYKVKALALVGISGATCPSLRRGELVSYKTIVNLSKKQNEVFANGSIETENISLPGCRPIHGATLNFLARDRAIKAKIYKRFGVQAVDMESYFICREASKYDVPFCVMRAISDTSEEELPEFMEDFSKNKKGRGTIKFLACTLRPLRAKEAFHSVKGIRKASANLKEAVKQWVLH